MQIAEWTVQVCCQHKTRRSEFVFHRFYAVSDKSLLLFLKAFVIKLWELTKDLIQNNRQTEYRHSALIFYKNLFQHQSKNLAIMREFFFTVIKDHEVDEDLQLRVEMLVALSENGKVIINFEEKIGQFMLDLAPLVLQGPIKLIHDYLDLLANIIQYNASHLESVILVGFVK